MPSSRKIWLPWGHSCGGCLNLKQEGIIVATVSLVKIYEQLVKKIKDQADKAVLRGIQNGAKKVALEVRDVMTEAVYDWYMDYKPTHGGRHYSLIDAIRVEVKDKKSDGFSIKWYFNTDDIEGWGAADHIFSKESKWSPLGGEALGDLTLKQGFHGGSYNGAHTWRYPYPYFTHDIGQEALQSNPPIQEIQKKNQKNKDKYGQLVAYQIYKQLMNLKV